MSEEDLVSWSPESMLEITLAQPDDFLKVRETLSRVGVASRKDKTLYQSCHILHKQGKYYIVHFKELFALDGKDSTITQNDIERRNTIAGLLQDWSLLAIVKNEEAEKKDDWDRWQFPTEANPRVDIKELETAKKEIGSFLYSQEYDAQFVEPFGGRFNKEWCKCTSLYNRSCCR